MIKCTTCHKEFYHKKQNARGAPRRFCDACKKERAKQYHKAYDARPEQKKRRLEYYYRRKENVRGSSEVT